MRASEISILLIHPLYCMSLSLRMSYYTRQCFLHEEEALMSREMDATQFVPRMAIQMTSISERYLTTFCPAHSVPTLETRSVIFFFN
jgi:hypothetical protein